MVLKDSVFYRDYTDCTFVLDTELNLSHRIPAAVGLFFDLFKEDITENDAVNKIEKLYPHLPKENIERDVHDFAEFLVSKNLVAGMGESVIKGERTAKGDYLFALHTADKGILYSAMIEITYACPERCKHCFQSVLPPGKRENELSFEEIKKVLDELCEMNVLELVITGGEPFARGDCFDILEYAKKKGFATTVFSNGILLENSDIERLAALKLKCFSTSLYSHLPKKHDEITGVCGSFEKTMNALRTLTKYGVALDIKFVLMEENKDDFRGVSEIAKEFGATLQLVPGLRPGCRGDCRINELNIKDDEALARAIADFTDFAGGKVSFENFDFSELCEAGRNNLSITPYGHVKPCVSLPYIIGNVRENTLESIWKRSRKLKKWRGYTKGKLKECRGCEYMKYCSFCPGDAMNFTGSMFKKYPEACRLAKIKHSLFTNYSHYGQSFIII